MMFLVRYFLWYTDRHCNAIFVDFLCDIALELFSCPTIPRGKLSTMFGCHNELERRYRLAISLRHYSSNIIFMFVCLDE